MASRMMAWIDKRFPLTDFVKKHLTRYPTPKNLNYFWNFGALAGAFFVLQVVTGIWLTMYYKPDVNLAFDSMEHIMRDVNYGWLIRYLHAIGPTGIFFAIYMHMARGIYYGSYKTPRELIWLIGILILLAFMAAAFMGYLLPWGQMSYWGATVITNLFSAIPVIGQELTIWLRGDFAVGDATLTRFFAFHTTLLPLGIIGVLLVMHLTALHRVGSSNPTGVDFDKKGKNVIPFAPYFVTKDLWFISFVFTIFFYFIFFQPDFFLEPLNNEQANPLQTPLHIVPEWYFLPFYAILRSIPHKFLGVLAMGGAIIILAFLPWLDRCRVRSASYRPVKWILTWLLFIDFVLLGYVGLYPPDQVSFVGLKMVTLGQLLTAYYFLYFLLMPIWSRIEPVREPPMEK